MYITRLVAAFALAMVTLTAPAGAVAQELSPTASTMQERIDEVIGEHGGTQTGWNEITWNDGDIVLTLESETDMAPSRRATAASAAKDDCAAGKYCVYAKTEYAGNKIRYSACPATYTSFTLLHASIHSIKNDLSSGTVRAYNGSTLKKTLSPGAGAPTVTNITKITCS